MQHPSFSSSNAPLRLNWYQRLAQPYPMLDTPRENMLWSIGASIFVAAFLWIFKPFGISIIMGNFGWQALGYGLITFVMSMFNFFLLPRLLPFVFREAHWTGWVEMLFSVWLLFTIGVANWVFASLIHPEMGGFSQKSFVGMLAQTVLVGIFPISVMIVAKQLRLLRQHLASAQQLTAHLHPQAATADHLASSNALPPTASTPRRVNIAAENAKDSLQILPETIRYIAAADNYVEVFYVDKNTLQRAIIRTTMRRVEENLADFPEFFRCHRTYIVNLSYVISVQGNAQGYRLQLTDTSETVPVSRNLNKTITEKLTATA